MRPAKYWKLSAQFFKGIGDIFEKNQVQHPVLVFLPINCFPMRHQAAGSDLIALCSHYFAYLYSLSSLENIADSLNIQKEKYEASCEK